MKYILLLKKDYSMEYCEINDSISFKNVKYIMMPINQYNLDTYVLIKPNFYLKHFTKVKLRYQLSVIEINGNGKSENKLYFPETEKEYRTLYETVNGLHSIQRIEYINSISNCDSFSQRYLVFNKFRLDAFEDDMMIYSYKPKLKNNKTIYPSNISEKINDFFSLEEITDRHLILNKNKWTIENCYPKNDVYSLYLKGTHSFYNIDFDNLALIKGIRSVMIITDQIIYGENEYQPYDSDLYYQDLWYFETERILEYLVYYNMIKSITTLITELIQFGELTNSVKFTSMLEIELFDQDDISIAIIDEIKNPLKYFINKLIEIGVDKNE